MKSYSSSCVLKQCIFDAVIQLLSRENRNHAHWGDVNTSSDNWCSLQCVICLFVWLTELFLLNTVSYLLSCWTDLIVAHFVFYGLSLWISALSPSWKQYVNIKGSILSEDWIIRESSGITRRIIILQHTYVAIASLGPQTGWAVTFEVFLMNVVEEKWPCVIVAVCVSAFEWTPDRSAQPRLYSWHSHAVVFVCFQGVGLQQVA